MRLIKRAIALVICTSIIFACTACKNDIGSATTTTTTTTSATKATADSIPQEETPAVMENYNNLTGKYDVSDEAEGKRAVAIMINNIDVSLPQYGIYDADVMFECPVEGGITRMMALYQDYTKVPDVCSVRSCRYYFALFASSFDAIYLHCGIDKKIASKMLEELEIDHIDGGYDTTLFKHDEERLQTYSSEHTVYCDGDLIPQQVESAGIRTDIRADFNKSIFDFTDEFTALSGDKCDEFTINFSGYYYSTFNYDSKSKTYKKQHNGEKHMDSAVNKQLEYTNVIILESKEIKVVNENNGLLSLDWTGGSGYAFSAGTYIPIKWSKASEPGKLVITDTDGNLLKLNSGKTYIGVTAKNTLDM